VRNLALFSPTSSFNRKPVHFALLLTVALSGCTTFKPPKISYDDDVPQSPDLPMPLDEHAKPLNVPPAWTPSRGGNKGEAEAKDPSDRIEIANEVARVQPRRAGYFNAVQVFPFSPGALYQIYASPGQITDIALEPGEQLTGSGPLAAGDTVRWIVGDTESGNGDTRRVHIMVKPTRPTIETNLVVNTDRRTYLIELRSREKLYMPSVAWFYPEDRSGRSKALPLTPFIPEMSERRYRYVIQGDNPPWRPSMRMTTAGKSILSSRPALVRAKCRRCSSSARTVSPSSSIIASTGIS